MNHFREILIFVKKWYIFKEFLPILGLISWSLSDDEGGMLQAHYENMSMQYTDNLFSAVKIENFI